MFPGAVIPISTATNRAGPPIRVSGPWQIAITPDGTTAYVANFGSDSVTPIDIATNTLGMAIALPVGSDPAAIAITPDGKTAYATNGAGGKGSDGSVTPINIATGVLERPIPAGGAPGAIAITPAGTAAYVANFNDDTVTVIRLKH